MDVPTEAPPTSFREVLAEFVGTAMLLVLIVGSGRQVEAFGLDPSAQFLAHAVSVGLGLAVLVGVFMGVSGSQFNPAVTLVAWWSREMSSRARSLAVSGLMSSQSSCRPSRTTTGFVRSPSRATGRA